MNTEQEYSSLLGLLARFHDREPDAELLEGMHEVALGGWLRELLPGESGKTLGARCDALCAAWAGNSEQQQMLDALAAEYADIYLTHAYRVSPASSAWLTDDNLDRQQPMFGVRRWYRKYGVEVPAWRVRADDHLVHQLQFLGRLLVMEGEEDAQADAARFLDENLLLWLPQFTAGVNGSARLEFYRLAADLTLSSIEHIRDHLEATTGLARQIPVDESADARKALAVELRYMPGMSESW